MCWFIAPAAGLPLLCTCCPLLISPGGLDISVTHCLIEVNRKNTRMGEWGRPAWRPVISVAPSAVIWSISLTLSRWHLEWKKWSSSLRQSNITALSCSSRAPPVGLFIKDRLSMQSSFTFTVSVKAFCSSSALESIIICACCYMLQMSVYVSLLVIHACDYEYLSSTYRPRQNHSLVSVDIYMSCNRPAQHY